MVHRVVWTDDGLPLSEHWGDLFFTGGPEEAEHVFLAGNDLPGRLRPGFQIAELGFGTGLNLLVLHRALLRTCGDPPALATPVFYTAFELSPLSAADMARALAPYALPGTDALLAAWEGACLPRVVSRFASQERRVCFALPGLAVEVILGDARVTVPRWEGTADAWFLDGFAPARNPEAWEPALLAAVVMHTVPGGTLATFTAAGAVRRALAAAGMVVERRPGYGRKRHMTIARKPCFNR